MSYYYEDFLNEQFLSPIFSGLDSGYFTNRLFQDRTSPWLDESLLDTTTSWEPAILVPKWTYDFYDLEPDLSWYTPEISPGEPLSSETSAIWRGTTMESLFRDPVLTPVLDYMWDDFGQPAQDSWHSVLSSDVGEEVVDVLGKRARSAWRKTRGLIGSVAKWGAKKVAAFATNPVVAAASVAYDAVQIGNWTWKKWQDYQEFSAAFDAIQRLHGTRQKVHDHVPKYYAITATRSEETSEPPERFITLEVPDNALDFPYAVTTDRRVRTPVLQRLSDEEPIYG